MGGALWIMNERWPFHAMLKALMAYVELSPARLAKQLDLAPSTIHKWLTGERIPSKKNIEATVDNISLAISGSMKKNPARLSRQEIISMLGMNSSFEEDGAGKNGKTDTEFIDKLLTDAYYRTRSSGIATTVHSGQNSANMPEAARGNAYTLTGYHAVIEEALNFIKAAAVIKAKDNTGRIIHLSNCHRFTFDLLSRFAMQDTGLPEKLKRNGWQIVNLLCMNRNEDAITPHIKDLLSILYSQENVTFKYKYFDTGHYILDDVLAVPGVGALLGFKVGGRMPDYAVAVRDPEGVLNLFNFYKSVAESYRPLYTINTSYPVFSTFSGSAGNDIYYINSRMGLTFLPDEGIADFLDSASANTAKKSKVNPAAEIAGFRNALMQAASTGRMYHIIPKSEMMRYITTGEIMFGNIRCVMNAGQRVSHIRRLQKYIDENPHYRLVFLDVFEDQMLPRINLLLFQDERAILETGFNSGSAYDAALPGLTLIREPLVLKAIHHYFQSVLNSTVTTGSDRSQTRQWLESLVDFLET